MRVMETGHPYQREEGYVFANGTTGGVQRVEVGTQPHGTLVIKKVVMDKLQNDRFHLIADSVNQVVGKPIGRGITTVMGV